jgi:capsular exopolysaccharide synthesis family protein
MQRRAEIMEQTMDRTENFLPRVDESVLTPSRVDRRVVTVTAPASGAAEQYRTLYYRLERMRELRPMKVVATTSAVSGEGKTLTAVNLALTAARANLERRILLIDADLRRSQVGEYLGIRNRPGLSELMSGDAETSEVVQRFKSTSLAVITGGAIPEEPAQLLASNRMKRLLQLVRGAFDEIYVDMPPSLPFADAAILGCQCDGVLMVIRANTTSFKRVSQGVEHLTGAPVIGCVLNAAELSAAPYLKYYLK